MHLPAAVWERRIAQFIEYGAIDCVSASNFDPLNFDAVAWDNWAWKREHRYGTLICDVEWTLDHEPAAGSRDGNNPVMARRAPVQHRHRPGPGWLLWAGCDTGPSRSPAGRRPLALGLGMKRADTIARVHRKFFVRGRPIEEIARDLHVWRNTVRKILRSGGTAFSCEREKQPLPRIGVWCERLEAMLAAANEAKPGRERLTLIRAFEELRRLGCHRFAPAAWRNGHSLLFAATSLFRGGRSSLFCVPGNSRTSAPGSADNFGAQGRRITQSAGGSVTTAID